ncbi:MAG: tRNA uridine-5-carboxymethylaminomethyl(34) synthesis GTPase MnmE [Prolixibacteraceae bacterium]|jgi:tRNA modification GTPase|nr:tRNA uridine-5-carboxymethylaminomethyl(34) synthesis GTPase MnmE [Prolixibacteraceae bacterium]
MIDQNTICAISTSPGMGAIAVIRLSGSEALAITDSIFQFPDKNKQIVNQDPNTLHYGSILSNNEIIDEVIVALFKAPHSFTGEDIVEISCHGSVYIQQTLLQLLIEHGCRIAKPGEFTQRAFLNGKMDLSQAEAVADLISSSSKASHGIALKQMRGGVSTEIKSLRNQLLTFTSLVELELDFSEEDVEFANRKELSSLSTNIHSTIKKLADSFRYGNALKNGIPVAIIGDANVGKSTLLNALLKEEKAIVSDIAGTTRDVIEDVVIIGGIQFRFIDTAGIRTTSDTIETIGIERTFDKIEQADIVLTLIDADSSFNEIIMFLTRMSEKLHEKHSALIINKIDIANNEMIDELVQMGDAMELPTFQLAAKHKTNLDQLIKFLIDSVQDNSYSQNDVLITNARHYESLRNAETAITRVLVGLQNEISGDFLSQDIRECLHYLGEITGDISTEEVLGNIFKNFCIGK